MHTADVPTSETITHEKVGWLTPAAYWTPAHLPVSAWYTHTPFAAWLMDTLRPSVVVELGTHFGCSCFTFAEAAKRFGHPCTIHAIDTWEGDDHAGFYGQEVFEYASRIADEDYRDSVRLLRARFDEARPGFTDGSVDLLHIDGRHGYEDVRADYEDWLTAVRDGGIILFHDIAERDNGFGVWRLWDEIASPGRSFTFEHGHGLGVLAVGNVDQPAIRRLFDADEPTADGIRAEFAHLGAEVKRRAWLETLPAELESLRAELARRRTHEHHLEERLDDQAAEIEALVSSRSWRLTAPLRTLRTLRPGNRG